jgi:DNA mismatch repair protein MSH6
MLDVGEEDSGAHAVCEYGVTIVDALFGHVTLGQFADDVLRSRMQTLLASFSPLEVSSVALAWVTLSSCKHSNS